MSNQHLFWSIIVSFFLIVQADKAYVAVIGPRPFSYEVGDQINVECQVVGLHHHLITKFYWSLYTVIEHGRFRNVELYNYTTDRNKSILHLIVTDDMIGENASSSYVQCSVPDMNMASVFWIDAARDGIVSPIRNYTLLNSTSEYENTTDSFDNQNHTGTINTTDGYRTTAIHLHIIKTCLSNVDCKIENSHCHAGYCKCNSGYIRHHTINGEMCLRDTTTTTTEGYWSTKIHLHLIKTCLSNVDCKIENSHCHAGYCKCNSGYIRHHTINGEMCLRDTTTTTTEGYWSTKKYLGDYCNNDYECTIENSECLFGTCRCRNGFTSDGNKCFRESYHTTSNPITPGYLDQYCDYNFECTIENSECRYHRCKCRSGYQTRFDFECIKVNKQLGYFCANVYGCDIPNSECVSNRCECRKGYKPNYSYPNDTCERVFIGDYCSSDWYCQKFIDNSYCEQHFNGAQCICRSGYQYSHGRCVSLAIFDTSLKPIAIGCIVLFSVLFLGTIVLAVKSICLALNHRKNSEYKQVIAKNQIPNFSSSVPFKKTPSPELKSNETVHGNVLYLEKSPIPLQRSDSVVPTEDMTICIPENIPFIHEEHDSTC